MKPNSIAFPSISFPDTSIADDVPTRGSSPGVSARAHSQTPSPPPEDERFPQSLRRSNLSSTVSSPYSSSPRHSTLRRGSFNVSELSSALAAMLSPDAASGPSRAGQRNHYVGAAQQTLTMTASFRMRYPNCVGVNECDVMVQGSDGRVRRCPVDAGGPAAATPMSRETPVRPAIGRHLKEQFDAIYDAPREAIHDIEAEFVHHADANTIGFQIRGEPAESLSTHVAAFRLPDGRLHIVQPGLKECSSACEEALKAHGKSHEQMVEQLKHYRPHGDRREVDEIRLSLEAAGEKVVELSSARMTAGESIAALKAAIDKHGPCILAMNGHTRMLDRIDSSGGVDLLSIRDPFTGSVLSVKNHERFWQMANSGLTGSEKADQAAPRQWDAIFLER